MYEFQGKFHPGEKIGFAWGIHHDTDHRHVHVYLCNRTDQGNHIALSNPLKGRRDKRKRKDQIGYMKERCVASEKRMIKAAHEMNRSKLPKYVDDLKIEHKKPYQMSEQLMEKERQLDEMRRSVISKKNQLQLKRVAIRQYSSQYYLQKEFIARGWQDVKAINESIREDFKQVKQNDSFISPKLLRDLDYVSDSGAIKFFSKMLFMMHNQQNVFKRQALFERINKSKEYKLHLLDQLKLLDQQQKVFYRNLKEMKQERDRIKQEFYESYNSYERQKEKFNKEFFREVIDDPQKINEYKRTTEELWTKRKSGVDCSEEVKTLQKLNNEARSKVEPPKKPERINQDQLLLQYGFFCQQIRDETKWLEYQEAVRQLLMKEERGEDYSHEVELLNKFDKEAKDIFTGVKKIPEVTQPKIEPEEEEKEEKPLEFDWEESRRNYEFFCQWVENRELQKDYWDTRMLITDKIRKREDFSLELKYLWKLDNKAEEIASQNSQGIESVIEEELPNSQEAWKNKWSVEEVEAIEKEIKRVRGMYSQNPALLKLSRRKRENIIQQGIDDLKENGIQYLSLNKFKFGKGKDSEKKNKGWGI